jgi:hypothetical protein
MSENRRIFILHKLSYIYDRVYALNLHEACRKKGVVLKINFEKPYNKVHLSKRFGSKMLYVYSGKKMLYVD